MDSSNGRGCQMMWVIRAPVNPCERAIRNGQGEPIVDEAEGCTTEGLVEQGWSLREIDAALDSPESRLPSTHWASKTGARLYDAHRVVVAAFRLGKSKAAPPIDLIEKFAFGPRPTSLPILTFDFHLIAGEFLAEWDESFSSLRLSHWIAGRRPLSHLREQKLATAVISRIIARAEEVSCAEHEIEERLRVRREGVLDMLGDRPEERLVIRACELSSYVSKATGPRALRRLLDVLALIQSGDIREPSGGAVTAVQAVLQAPALRLDAEPRGSVSQWIRGG